MNRLFGQTSRPAADERGEMPADWAPAIDVQETDGEYVINIASFGAVCARLMAAGVQLHRASSEDPT